MGKSMKRKKSVPYCWDSAYLNNLTFYHYFDRLYEIAVSRFDWQGLPDTVDSVYMERILFDKGNVLFFYEPYMQEYYIGKSANGGKLNIYNIPNRRDVYAPNGYHARFSPAESVIIYNNAQRRSIATDIQVFAWRLANIERSIDVNTSAVRTPVIVECEDNQRLTVQNLLEQYDGNKPVIVGRKGLMDNVSISYVTSGAPFLADKLEQLKANIWNEALGYLGISNISSSKKANLLSDEVMRMQGGAISARQSPLACRKRAADQINKKFGLNISVEFRDIDLSATKVDDFLTTEERTAVDE